MALLYTIVVGCIVEACIYWDDITCNHIQYPTDCLILGNITGISTGTIARIHTHIRTCDVSTPVAMGTGLNVGT